jgi:Fe2+ transport system protein B
VEELKAALRELARREPEFLIGLIADAASSRRDLALKLASVVAGVVAVPLDVATKQDIRRLERRTAKLEREVQEIKNAMATKEDIKRLEDRMATKEQFEAIAISVEDSGRDMVQYLLEQRGHRCAAERLRVDSDYEFDIYCNAGALTAVGEAKVRAGRRDVERAFERARELQRRMPDKISGRLVAVLYTLVAEPSAVQRAKELKVWLIEGKREVVPLEEALG